MMWDPLPGVGPELLGFRIPPFSLKSHCSGNCLEDPHEMDIIYNGYFLS